MPEIALCPTCGGLVDAAHMDVHLAWHATLNALVSRPSPPSTPTNATPLSPGTTYHGNIG